MTRAARRSGLSQPAMSRALGRLRVVFRDELFVRTPGGVEPTPRAEELRDMLHSVREQVEGAVMDRVFDPANAQRTFNVYGADFAEILLLPELMRRLSESAPGVVVHFFRTSSTPDELLTDRGVDLVLNPRIRHQSQSIVGQKLFAENFVVIARLNHPKIQKRLTLNQFVAADHLLIAPRGRPGGIVDKQLLKRGLSRTVKIQVPSFLSAPQVVANTDIIATIPERLAAHFARTLPLRDFPPPLAVPPFSLMQYWSLKNHHDPAHRYLRETVLSVASLVANAGFGSNI